MIRAFAVCAAFIPAFVLPAEVLPTNPTKAEGDVRAASNYRTVTYRVDKKLKGDCETQEILLSNPMPAGIANEGYEIGGECKNLSVEFINIVSSIHLIPNDYKYWYRLYMESGCPIGPSIQSVIVRSND